LVRQIAERNLESAMETDLSGGRNYVLRALERFTEYGGREALVRRERRITYAELGTAIKNLAAAMRHHGVRSGMAVAVLVERPLEAPILQLALHALGVRSIWIDVDNLRRDLPEYLDLVRPEILLYDARDQDAFGREIAGMLNVPVLCLGPGGLGPDLLAERGHAFDPGWAAHQPESVFQTSGTTGRPKLVHHRESFYRQVLELGAEPAGGREVRHVSVSGLSYLAGQVSALIYLFSGSTLILLEGFETAEWLATVQHERATSAFISPPVLYLLLDSPLLESTDLGTLTVLSVGAAAATVPRLRQAIRRFGPIVRITYGLSECPWIAAFPGIGEPRLRSCGQPYGDVRVEIRDESGSALRPGEVGELWVRSRLNFAGYWGQPELTAGTLVDGWVRTHDLGYRDEDGYLYLVGRNQDMIIAGQYCEKIYPRPIEDVLTGHPQVRAAAVIGVPEPEFGEAAHAYVVSTGGALVTADELAELVRGELAAEWVPTSFEFVDSLPLTAIGKVNTAALRRRYAEEHGGAVVGSPA
jgi:acyl-CoA synthetase (AMP-forming)/AMP-acid ligase II